MSFGHPLLLLTLLVVPAAILALRLAERRRMRYAVRYTNLDVLAGVVAGRQWRRYVPTAVGLLALAVLCVALAASAAQASATTASTRFTGTSGTRAPRGRRRRAAARPSRRRRRR